MRRWSWRATSIPTPFPSSAAIRRCDIDPDATLDLVTKYFAPIPGGTLPERPPPARVELAGQTRVDVEAGVELGRVAVVWPTPPNYAPGDGELDLVARALIAGGTSRLYKRLVYDDQIAQDVSANQSSQQLASRFEISATAKPGHTPEELLKAIDGELARVRDGGVTDLELGRARTGFLATSAFDLEQVGRRADHLNAYAHYTGDPGFLPKDIARYEGATAASLRDAVRTWLPADRRVVVVIRPTKGAPLCGRLAGGKP